MRLSYIDSVAISRLSSHISVHYKDSLSGTSKMVTGASPARKLIVGCLVIQPQEEVIPKSVDQHKLDR